MHVSVVIRARNEAPFIGDILGAVFEQIGTPSPQVIIVDSGSTDGTQDIVRRFPAHLIEIPAPTFSYGRALNIGVEAATGTFVASLSAHSLPVDRHWLAGLLMPFSEPLVAAVYGRQVPRANATWLELLGMHLSGVRATRPRLHRQNPMFSNANGAYRRAPCLARPFDEQVGGGEDLEWARGALEEGYLIAYEPSAAVYHSHGEPLLKHARRTLRDLPTVAAAMFGLQVGTSGASARQTNAAQQ